MEEIRKMNKKELAEVVAEKFDLSKAKAGEVVDTVFESITDALADGKKVEINGFGKFEVKTRAARTGINPQTKETINIPASKAPAFKAGKALKDSLN